MSFRASSSVMDQKPSRQVKQKRRSEYGGRSNDYDMSDGYQEAYKRREKYSNWKHQIADDDGDDE